MSLLVVVVVVVKSFVVAFREPSLESVVFLKIVSLFFFTTEKLHNSMSFLAGFLREFARDFLSFCP